VVAGVAQRVERERDQPGGDDSERERPVGAMSQLGERAVEADGGGRLWSEHLELPVEQLQRDPIEVIDELWKPISKEQLERRTAGLPLTHRLVCLPHVSKRSGRLLGPLSGLLVDG
jgi:hypothetical protein